MARPELSDFDFLDPCMVGFTPDEPIKMEFKIRTPSVVPLTTDLVVALAEMANYKGNRDITIRRGRQQIERLLEKWREGAFHPCEWVVADCLWDDENGERIGMRKINCQHSIALFLYLIERGLFHPGDGRTPEAVHLDTYECYSSAGEGQLFKQFDNRWSSRTTKECLAANAGATEALSELLTGSMEGVARMSRGIKFYYEIRRLHGDDTMPKLKAEQVEELMFTYPSFFLQFKNMNMQKKFHIHRGAIWSAVFASYLLAIERDIPELAYEFWSHVDKDTHPDPANQSRLLSKWLINPRVEVKNFDNLLGVFNKCSYAFGRYLDGSEARTLRGGAKVPHWVMDQEIYTQQDMQLSKEIREEQARQRQSATAYVAQRQRSESEDGWWRKDA